MQIKHAQFVGDEKKKMFISLPASNSYMLRNHKTGLSDIKKKHKKDM